MPGLFHSAADSTSVPPASSTAVAASVTRVSTDQPRGRRHRRASSNTTGKPSPPTMTAALTDRMIHGSSANRTRPSGHSVNPALLNDETAWNTPRYAARPGGSP